MHSLYYIVSPSTNGIYVGITKCTLEQRFSGHKCDAKRGKNTHLYSAMRKYKDFCIVLIERFSNRMNCCKAEMDHILELKENGLNVYNLTSGGEYGFVVEHALCREEWINKLKAARKGKKPALGMKHTEENKKLFSDCGKQRWDKYGRYPDDIINLSFKDAKNLYGISKTHYYRLKRANINDIS